jgi:hypothetical protein
MVARKLMVGCGEPTKVVMNRRLRDIEPVRNIDRPDSSSVQEPHLFAHD